VPDPLDSEGNARVATLPNEAIARVGPSIDYRDPVDAYIAGLPRERSKKAAVESLIRIARTWGYDVDHTDPECFRDIPWATVDAKHTTALRAMLQAKDYAPATMRLTLSVLRGVLRMCRRFQIMSAEQFERALDFGKVPADLGLAGRALSSLEIASLRRYCTTLPPFVAAYGEAVLGVTLGAGLRISEVAFLQVTALGDDGYLRVEGKGGRVDRQPLRGWALEAVRRWLKARARFPFQRSTLFVALVRKDGRRVASDKEALTPRRLREFIYELAKGAGVDAFVPHDLRRTFGTAQIREGLGTAQKLMRHKNGATTMRYDRSTEVAAAAALEKTMAELGGRLPKG
jgi:integrase